MTVPKETESKLELPRSAVGRLAKLPLLRKLKERERRETYVSVYFDTDKFHLKKHGFTFRVRRIGDRHVQTIQGRTPRTGSGRMGNGPLRRQTGPRGSAQHGSCRRAEQES